MNNKYLTTAAAITAASMLQFAHADDYLDKRWYAAPFGTFIGAGPNNYNRGGDGAGAGLSIGKIIDRHFNVEIRGLYQNDQNVGARPVEWESAGATVDGQYFFSRGKFSPYTVLALGGLSTDVTGKGKGAGKSGASFILEPGVGMTYELTDNFLIRSDIRYRYNNSQTFYPGTKADSQFNDLIINVGFVIPFGAKPTAAKLDIPAPTQIAEAPIRDCSSLDDDADRVNNCLDQCPGTLPGSKVNFKGCAVSLELKGVHFKVDSAELTENARGVLNRVADSLISYPEKGTIEVHGHTSSEASDAHNMALSIHRSQAVVNYLKMKGVANPMIARGYGESKPIADNLTEEGRSINRRVELIWTGN